VNASIVAKENLIFKCKVGSALYGTATETSDTDYSGVFVPPKEALFGLSPVDNIDMSIVSKGENGRNTKEAVDLQLHSVQKFARLAIQGNPAVLEMLFVPDACVVYGTDYFNLITQCRKSFIGMQIIPRFVGYASSQKHKMIIRSNEWTALNNMYEWLSRFAHRVTLDELENNPDHKLFCWFDKEYCHVGTIMLQRGIIVKNASSILYERISKGTNRQEIILKYGYDSKFASHLIRLLMECKELLQTGELEFPLRYADYILQIKRGDFAITEVLDAASRLEDDIRLIAETKPLPPTGDFNVVEQAVVKCTEEFWSK
jgi:predicted nucleotidyltransferase